MERESVGVGVGRERARRKCEWGERVMVSGEKEKSGKC